MLDPKDEQVAPPCLPPRSRFTSQDSLLAAPALPPRSKTSKRVSYAPQEATVLGSPPESNLVHDLHNKSLERRQRQIFPGTHMAPSEPPTEEEREAFTEDEGEKRASREEESEEPVLPSVRQLASRFQVTFLASNQFLFLDSNTNILLPQSLFLDCEQRVHQRSCYPLTNHCSA